MARRIAILVGNGRFLAESELAPLQGPPNDVASLAAVLQDADRGGFEVQQFVDARKDVVLPVIDEVLNAVEAEDLVLLFYAGHGKLDPSGRLCLATAETRAAALRSTSIPVSELKELVAQSRAGGVILLLDCCFSGAIGKEFRSGVDDQLALMQDAQGLHILTAATGLQTARERDADSSGNVMGAFTRVIVDGISSGAADRDGDGEITLSDLRRHLQETIRGQTPKYFAHDASGDPRIARARPPETREQKRLRRLGRWYNEGVIPEALYPTITDAASGEGDPKLVALVQRMLDNKEMRARQLVSAWEAAVAPPSLPEPPRSRATVGRFSFPDTFASKPPEEAIAVPASKATLKAPVGVFVGGIAVALFGVFAMFWKNSDDYSVVILFGMAMMAGGGIWGGVRLLGRAARSIKGNWSP
jgi:Caspase domain